ncbi:MAG: hypothetical protein FWD17_05370 [Polyangiaceae bacterium]|nr:hypothetical protein [Polyangiaceae bacterium]
MTDATRRTRSRRPPFAIASIVLLGAVLVSAPLRAGGGIAVLKGKVVGWEKLFPQAYAEASKNDARRYNWREPSPTVKQDFRKLSANVSRDVCVVALSASGGQPHEPIAVKLTGGRLTPSTLVLSPGSRISIKNVDPFPHELYEVGNGSWAANAVAPGSSREWAATAPGTHVIRDQLFGSVVLYVVVDPGVVELSVPDHEGMFSMSLPPGEYTLKAFFDGRQAGRETPVHVGNASFEMREALMVGGGESKSGGDAK